MTKPLNGIECLRATVALFSLCREGFNQRFTADELIKLTHAYKACGFDMLPDTWTEHQIERALDGDTDLFTPEGEPLVKYHYVYGSGLRGYMYDNGPCATETLSGAVDSALYIFHDGLTEEQIETACVQLTEHWFHAFPRELRESLGAEYVEISRVDGPMPEGEE